MKKLILASQSEGRKELMKEAGFEFVSVPACIDETQEEGETGEEHVTRLSLEKARKVACTVSGPAVIIGADVVARFQGRIIGKAANKEDARKTLRSFAYSSVEAICGYAVIDTETGKEESGYDIAVVHFGDIPERDIEECIASGIAFSCGGSFAIRRDPCNHWVKRIDGDSTVVIGLPMRIVKAYLNKLLYA